MTPARLQKIEEIFQAALDQEPDQIGAFLDNACEGDKVLRSKVEALLSSRQRASTFIETSAVGLATKIIENGQAELLVGQTFGHYKISKRIGSGGMGEVYLAADMTAGRKAALKLLPMRFTGDAERLKRFQQEARAVAALNHPNILTVYEIGQDHSIHYIASELIEGETLRQRLTRGPMQLSEAVDIAIQVASALAAAHQAGIVHRDIKPENIMLRPDGYVKVLDFGIAKLAESAFAEATADGAGWMTLAETNLGSILGTVRYMSPEQACGAHVDKGTDIWSLGVVLYEMVARRAPFIGNTPREVMSALVEKEPSPLTKYMARNPAELQQIISKTLRKDREERYHSTHELLEALKDLRRKLEFESFFKSGFFDEVKRRKLYRVAAAYIIVAAGIIQLASAAFPAWDLPDWALRLVIALLLIGFPLALVLGWAFDLTSQGIRATPGTHRRRYVMMLVAAGVIISTAAGFFLLPRVSAYKIDKSIAVLPLENHSGDATQEYFADGITEALITELAKVRALRVMSRESVVQYKQSKKPLPQIGRELNVNVILTGSVARSGDHARIAVQLTDAGSGQNLWSESYERGLRNLLTLPKQVARDIASETRVRLTTQEELRLGNTRPVNPEAYDQYLRGQFYFHKQTRESNEAAIAAFERAAANDPSFAAAHAALAQAYVWKLFLFAPNELKLAENAFVEIEKALALDPNLGLAYLARGRLLWTPSNRFPHEKAIREYRRALDLDPSLDEARNQLALVYCHVGLFEEALQELRRAVAINPNNNLAQFRIGETLLFQGKYEEALTGLRSVPWEVNPSLVGNQIAMTLLHLGRNEEAGATLDRLLRDFPEDNRGLFTSVQAIMAALEGDVKLAEEKIGTAIDQGKGFGHFHHTAYHIACAYALMSKIDDALKWLEHAADDGFPCYPMFTQDTMLNNLRQEPRFDVLMARLKTQWENYRRTF
jgi:serine/threonine protein kinase/TolB-like protein/Tfp pilus assembly protein PilF